MYENNHCSSPTLISSMEERSWDIACGLNFSLLLTYDGRVYSWGCGQNGVLGIGDEYNRSSPTCIDALEDYRIMGVACGTDHCAAFSVDGVLFTWGNGEFGRLGHGNNVTQLLPVQLSLEKYGPVKVVACGFAHTAVVTENGALLTWGCGYKGPLGHGEERTLNTPRRVEALADKRIYSVSCGDHHTAAITENGELYTWGSSGVGQLGHGSTDMILVPTRLFCFLEKRVLAVSCGSNHTCCITDGRKMYSWGKGTSGQLGHGDAHDRMVPTQIRELSGLSVCSVVCGATLSAALTADGLLYTWGD
eukprot:GFYU01056152.1.p1 GENE.GFYU01056152.1~~GFYU01056152.1.p1  ORF type:complete len:318 (-),score=63.85 GFYU01056152.1:11-925(-)